MLSNALRKICTRQVPTVSRASPSHLQPRFKRADASSRPGRRASAGLPLQWAQALCVAAGLLLAAGPVQALSPRQADDVPRSKRSSELTPFQFPINPAEQRPACQFDELKLAEPFRVLAAGAYAGRKLDYPIDASGHEATQIDVAVNSPPEQPVVLMLGAYEPTVWNIGWAKGTRIAAVLVSGYHRQAVAGLEKSTPLMVSSYDNKGPCGYFYLSSDGQQLDKLNPLALRLFNQKVEMVYPAVQGRVVVGEPLREGVPLLTSATTRPESFRDPNAPLAGAAGLRQAVKKRQLRLAAPADLQKLAQAQKASADRPPVAGDSGVAQAPPMMMGDAYVVLKPMRFPAGLYGAHAVTFLLPKGVPMPQGNPGHSPVYDLGTGACRGPICR